MKPLSARLLPLVFGVCSAAATAADSPTYYSDALPVFQKNCVACHQDNPPDVGGISAPFSLADYEQARVWAPLIRRAVETGYMPPWGAHERHKGQFVGERYLEKAEKELILAWVDGGAREGDPADAQNNANQSIEVGATVMPPSGWWIGDPDLVVQFEEPVHVGDDVEDWQPTIRMPVPEGALTEPRWISQAELDPGGPWVHHIVSSHMGVGVPGRGPFTYPEGWGVLLPENPFITVNMHYHKNTGPGTGVDDLTRAGFKFYEDGDVIDYVVETNLLPHHGWTIPAGASNYEVSNTFDVDEDIYLLSMGPHMHYRGKAMRYELEYPDGEQETLLWVPKYDFNWQFLYEYKEPKFIPAGSTLHMSWWFDNSESNPWNPDPTQEVVYGPATTDEMANARIYYAPAIRRGIVVGKDLPADVLAEARASEQRRRENTAVDFGPSGDDFSWLTEDEN
ncbi:MAG: cytochrome c [Gammaproteobacteria bacterium]|nr:cytochrome c [Pseudomonadales bacterium]MCP5348711.1 cytochrome c [Pseudomonadales bacterium]